MEEQTPLEFFFEQSYLRLEAIELRAKLRGEDILAGVALQTSWMRRSVAQRLRRIREARHGR